MYSMSKVVREKGGYGYTLHGPLPVRCWSRLKPDIKKISKSLARLNSDKLPKFSISINDRSQNT